MAWGRGLSPGFCIGPYLQSALQGESGFVFLLYVYLKGARVRRFWAACRLFGVLQEHAGQCVLEQWW